MKTKLTISTITALLFFIALPAFAWDEPDGFKEFKFGMTRQEIIAVKERSWKEALARMSPELRASALKFNPFSDVSKASSLGGDTIGEIELVLGFYYEKGADGVERIGSVNAVFDHSSFNAVKAAFIERYGQPTSTESKTYTNGYGARFEGETLSWEGTSTLVRLNELTTSRTQSSFTLATLSYMKQLTERSNQKARDAAKDLR